MEVATTTTNINNTDKEMMMGSQDRLDSPDRELSQGYMSDENLSDKSDMQLQADPNKIFSVKQLNLGKIKCFGFDMDHTLCEYISPAYDLLAFELTQRHMVEKVGYPKEVMQFKYNPSFPTRGLWLDKLHGNLLKVDQLGNILLCMHGFRKLTGSEIRALYPHKIIKKDNDRIFVMNTLFNMPETFLFAAIVDLYNRREGMERMEHGWRDTNNQNNEISFRKLFQDLRSGVDYIHMESMELKTCTVKDLPRYVKKDDRLVTMLRQMRDAGRKTFLLTNSDWWYTNIIMGYLLKEHSAPGESSWLSWFDLTVVDGCKPRFFTTGTPLKQVNLETRELLPVDQQHTLNHTVYSGGDHQTITRMIGVDAPEILYCGDHLYGDVIKCRKESTWKTLLVVPELEYEVNVIQQNMEKLMELTKIQNLMGNSIIQMDELTQLRDRLVECVQRLDSGFGNSGSLFRAGSRLSYFGSQMMIWADVYTGSVMNLAEYGINQMFFPPTPVLPHETNEALARGDSPVEDLE